MDLRLIFRRYFSYLFVLFVFLSLAGCATRSIYRPIKKGVGYASQTWEDGTLLVSIRALDTFSKDRLWDLCLLRCAELAVMGDAAYFEILYEQFDEDVSGKAYFAESPSALPIVSVSDSGALVTESGGGRGPAFSNVSYDATVHYRIQSFQIALSSEEPPDSDVRKIYPSSSTLQRLRDELNL